MRQIYSIAKAELSILFYSPIAWLIIVIFSFQSYSAFAGMIENMVGRQELQGGFLRNVTMMLFTDRQAIYSSIQQNLYLYVPLLTMGLMSREMSSGSIKLLYSSPVSDIRIIMGKFLSIMIFTIIMMAVIAPTLGFAWFKVESADMALAISGLFGLTLLMFAYASIGLFMSTLTSYQVVAAMLTLGVLAFLSKIGTLAQDVLFLRDITYWLSMAGRVESFVSGLITSEDILYFLIVIALFCAFSVITLQSSKRKNNYLRIVLQYAGVVLVAVLLGYISSRPHFIWYHDATQTKRNTITENTQEIIKQLEGPMKITTYVNFADNNFFLGLPRNLNNDFKRLQPYYRFKPDINMEYVYYYDDPLRSRGFDPTQNSAEDLARLLTKVYNFDFNSLLKPSEIRPQINLFPEQNSFVRLVEMENGATTWLRVYDDMQRHPGEAEISAAFLRMIQEVPTVAFSTGHGEPSIHRRGDADYASITTTLGNRNSLINQGFDLTTINLAIERNGISGKADIFVLADPKAPLSEEAIQKVLDYIEEGGNMMIAVEPGRTDYIKPIADRLGIRFLPGTLVHPAQDFVPTLIPARVASQSRDLSFFFNVFGMGTPVTMPGAVGLDFILDNEFEIIPVAATGPRGFWNEVESDNLEIDTLRHNRAAGEQQRLIPTALALTRMVNGKEQRIMVLGDADCLSNGELGAKRTGLDPENESFGKAMFHWLSDGMLPIDVRRDAAPDNKLYVSMDELKTYKMTISYTLPVLLTLLGAFIVLRRKRR